MLCKSPTMIRHGNIWYKVPCQKCLPCKINKTSEWKLRLLMELKTNSVASFVTLTYNNDNLPSDRSLHKEDLSNFNKAFRQDYSLPIKFFACGEYGDNPERLTFFGDNVDSELVKRPHYHSIMFGVDNSYKTREILYENWHKCDSWKFFGKTWYKTVGQVTADSCSYVAGYCQKKLFGDLANDEYKGKIPPFQLQSKKIGEEYFLQHIDEYKKIGGIPFNGVIHSIPATWKRKFDIVFSPEIMEKNLQRELDKFNRIHKSNFKTSELHNALINSCGISSVYDFLEKTCDEILAYSDYIEFRNNLRKQRK